MKTRKIDQELRLVGNCVESMETGLRQPATFGVTQEQVNRASPLVEQAYELLRKADEIMEENQDASPKYVVNPSKVS